MVGSTADPRKAVGGSPADPCDPVGDSSAERCDAVGGSAAGAAIAPASDSGDTAVDAAGPDAEGLDAGALGADDSTFDPRAPADGCSCGRLPWTAFVAVTLPSLLV